MGHRQQEHSRFKMFAVAALVEVCNSLAERLHRRKQSFIMCKELKTEWSSSEGKQIRV